MHTHSTAPWRHEHTFGQERPRAGERRTLIVLALTAATMVVEVAAGVLYPVAGVLLSPVMAAAAMALSSVSVIGNALRLRAVRL